MAKQPPVKKTAPTKAAPTKAIPTAKATPTPVAAVKYDLARLTADVANALPLVSSGVVAKVVQATFAAMTEAYASGAVVNIKDFGKLEIKHRPARTGRNPANGETIQIAAKSVPKFTFAKALKDAVK